MSQNDWNFNTYYLNGTPAEGTSILHSSLTDPIQVTDSSEDRCRRWQFYANGHSGVGCFIRTKKTEFVNVEDVNAISVRAWIRSQNDGNRNAYTGIFIKATSDYFNPSGYGFDLRPSNNLLTIHGTNYSPPTGLTVQSNKWYHIRFDVIPIKHNNTIIMDHLKGFIEINGEWVLVGEKYVEVTDSNFVSWTGTTYNGVRHYYDSYYSTSYFYVDKIKMYLEKVADRPEKITIGLLNDTGDSNTDNITSDPTLTITSTTESGSVVQYSSDGYNWQAGIPAAVSGSNSTYVRQVGADGKTSNVARLDFLYAPEGPAFSSEATSSVYQGAGSNFLIYRTEASSLTDFSFDLRQVDDYADFSISSSSGLVYAKNNLDYATKNSYNFTVTATDLAGNTTEKPVLLNVLEKDDHYYDTSLILKMDNDLSCSSAYEQDVTVSGVQLTGSTSKYGGSSAYFDGGTNTGLQIPSSGLLDLRNIDWTMEAWINPDGDYSDHRKIIAKRNYSGTYDYQIWLGQTTGHLAFWNSSTTLNSGVTPPANQWTHVAAVRKDGVVTLYINGEAKASQTLNITNHRNVNLGIGNVGDLNRHPFRGYIDDVRITKGIARYTEDFAPPGPVPSSGGEAITASAITEDLFMNIDPSLTASYPGSGSYIYDTVNNTQSELYNGASIASGSLVFDGTNDYLNFGSVMNLSIFTISVAVKPGTTQVEYTDIFDNNHTSTSNFVLQQDIANTNNYSFGIPGSTGTDIFYLDPNEWHILTFCYSNTSGLMFYKNGELVSSKHAGSINVSSQSLNIARWNAGGRHWNGEMGFFKIYNKPLSLVEVRQDYEANKARFGLT